MLPFAARECALRRICQAPHHLACVVVRLLLCRGQATELLESSRVEAVSEPTSRASSRESSKPRVQFHCCAIEPSQSLGESSPVSPRRVENFRGSLKVESRMSRVASRASRGVAIVVAHADRSFVEVNPLPDDKSPRFELENKCGKTR